METSEAVLYSAEVPVVNEYGEIVDVYPVNFRNDPRELGSVELEKEIANS